MALSFHKFPELPTELRLQIWEAACSSVITTYHRRGLQYVDLQTGFAYKEVIVPETQSSGQGFIGKKNRSAYLGDSGLWKACKESKHVVTKHARCNKGFTIREKAWDKYSRILPYYRYIIDETYTRPDRKMLGEKVPHPVLIAPCEGSKGQCPMFVFPEVDIFCIQTENWNALKDGKRYFLDIKVPFLAGTRGGRGHNLASHKPGKIALEYETGWVTDFPDSPSNLCNENSARGHFAYLLKQRLPLPTLAVKERLWILDKEIKWFAGPGSDQESVIWDCDAQYIEVQWSQVVHKGNVSVDKAVDAAGFIEKLDRLFCHNDKIFPWYYSSSARGPWRSNRALSQMVRLLARRDNEVKETAAGCLAKCHEIGWCLCSDEVGERQ